jgi:hypothetical protein
LILTIVVYLLVAWFVVTSAIIPVQGPAGITFPILAVLSAGLLALQLFLRTFLSDAKLFPRIYAGMPDDLSDGPEIEDCAGHLFLANHMSLGIIIWVTGEAPAIFGLVLTLLSGDLRFVVGFAVYSIVNLFVFRPKRRSFDEQLTRMRGYLAAKR